MNLYKMFKILHCAQNDMTPDLLVFTQVDTVHKRSLVSKQYKT